MLPNKSKKITASPGPSLVSMAPKTPVKNPETLAPEIKPIQKPKPLVEGINTPVLTPVQPTQKAEKLTSAEESLIRNLDIHINREPAHIQVKTQMPKITLMPETRPKKRSLVLTIIMLILVLAVLGFSYYIWRIYWPLNKNQYSNTPSNVANSQNYKTGNITTASGTAASQGLKGTTASSTPINPNDVGKNTADLFTPPAPVKQLTIKNTPTGYLNVRELPTTGSKLLTKVNPGQAFAYTEIKNGWYKITLSDASSGWVIGTYVTVKK